ncbi:MAG: YncE family protein, partial [Acidobacteria bacterium]|nr:YncE family protein [Acidobacteriota bacterium]
GTLAVTTERNNGRVAIIDLATFTVSAEVAVGGGPSSVAIDGNQALVVNQDTDSVSLIDLSAKTVTKTIAMGRGPRSIAVDAAGGKAYVTNQDVGTISVISLATLSVINTFDLGAEARPQTIQVIPSLNMAVITDPSAGPEGRVWIVNLLLGTTTFVGLHKDRTGGASAVALNGTIAFFASQAARTVTVVPVDLISGGVLPFNTVQIQVGLGPRALAIDLRDNLLLVLNEGSGIITLIDLNTNLVVGTIDVTN